MTRAGSELQIGLISPSTRREVEALEALPVDSLWTGGHVAAPHPVPEAMQGLARLAALSERAKVGASILLLPLYPPALVAKQIADLDDATGGRVILGVGVGGEYPAEFRAVQVPLEERGRRANEMIPLIRRFWSAEPVTHRGRYYQIDDVRIHPAPAQPGGPPIVVAGRQEAAMRRAGRLGDGWFPYLYSPRRYAASVESVERAAAEAGRDLAGFGWYVWIFLNIRPDGREAREEAARSMGGSYDQDFSKMVDSVAAAGTPEEVTAKVQAFYDAGARHFVFCPATAGSDYQPVLDRLFGEVVPALREHADRSS